MFARNIFRKIMKIAWRERQRKAKAELKTEIEKDRRCQKKKESNGKRGRERYIIEKSTHTSCHVNQLLLTLPKFCLANLK